jgi:hypothetical protein
MRKGCFPLYYTGACVIFHRLAIERDLEMRFFAILAVSAAALTPALASADPGQPQTAPAATLATTATPASQQTAQATPVAAPANSGANLDQIECRTGTPPTGTRLGATRECHTVREWNKRQQDSQDIMRRTQAMGEEGMVPGMNGGGKH